MKAKFQLQKSQAESKKGRGLMQDQNPRKEFIQGLESLEEAAVELNQSIKELNKRLDELNKILESR